MQKVHIECQGLPCPQPVLKSRDAIERDQPSHISVVVDNEAAKDNVSRFLGTQGYEASSEQKDGNFIVTGIKQDDKCAECVPMTDAEIDQTGQQKNLIFIGSDVIGSGDDELGGKLMYNFLLTLNEMGRDLWRIVMVNGGVKLASDGHPCLEPLKKLEEDGVSVLVCGTCLEHFGLTGSRKVGDVTNMLDIITSFQLATKTIRV